MRIPANKLLLITLLLTSGILSACGGNSEEEEKGPVEYFTKETADKAVHYIQDPIDKAQNVQILSNQHSEQVQQAAEAEVK